MMISVFNRFSGRSAILGALSMSMVLSLLSSLSVRYGHADVPVAETVEQITPLQVGQSAPRFTVETVDNDTFEFDPRGLDRPALVIMFRGGWCMYCNAHLSELRHVVPEITASGVDVLFLSGDRPELLYRSLQRDTQDDIEGRDYRILSDAGANAAIAFGVAYRVPDMAIERRHANGDDIAESSMARHGILPVPSVFAIGRDGIIAFAYSQPNYRIRLPADELLEVARTIAAR